MPRSVRSFPAAHRLYTQTFSPRTNDEEVTPFVRDARLLTEEISEVKTKSNATLLSMMIVFASAASEPTQHLSTHTYRLFLPQRVNVRVPAFIKVCITVSSVEQSCC